MSALSSGPVVASTPSNPLFNFTNCITLLPSSFNLHWSLSGDSVEFGLETVDDNKSWAGFGLSDPTLQQVSMLKADVVVTGTHPSVANNYFANQYFLSERSQCNYDTKAGVCPTGNTSGLTLIGGTVDNGVRLVRFKRSLTSGRYPINPSSPQFFAWAFGPLSDDQTKPVVLYHGPNRAPTNFSLQLSTPVNSCGKITPNSAKTADPSKSRIVRGAKSLEITTGPNPNYPNPPGWGLSYYVNGVESPVIVVNRGQEYTFVIKASSAHPLYITSSQIGGKAALPTSTETILAGDNGAAAGTAEKPYILKWTVPADFTSAYYQCYDHQKLGWKIVEASQPEALTSSSIRTVVGSIILLVLLIV